MVLYLTKCYRSWRLIAEFPGKKMENRGLDMVIKKLCETGSAERKKGSGRPKSARTAQNVTAVSDMAWNRILLVQLGVSHSWTTGFAQFPANFETVHCHLK
jgi:hypothetical protein